MVSLPGQRRAIITEPPGLGVGDEFRHRIESDGARIDTNLEGEPRLRPAKETMHRHFKILLSLLMITIVAIPASAFTIYLKDGSRLIAKEKHRIEDGKAIIVLQNGTSTFIELSEIDIPRTEQANLGDYGTALILEDGQLVEAQINPTEQKQQRLTDVASKPESGGALTRPQTRRQASAAPSVSQQRVETGAVDLTTFPRAPYSEMEISAEATRFLRTLGIEGVQVYQGSDPNRAFLEITTNSEAAVFRGLDAAADTLLHLLNRYPDRVQSLELLMSTSDRDRAGQFHLTREVAVALADNDVEASELFIQHVQF